MTMTKSSLMSGNDPFMSDHQSTMAVDPNYFLNDSGTLTKDESQDFSTFPALMEWATMDDSQLENLILDGFGGMTTETTSAAPVVASTLGNSFGTSLEITPSHSPEYDFEEFLSNLKFENGFDADQLLNGQSAVDVVATDIFEASISNSAVDLTPPLTPVHQTMQDPLSACLFESGIANFEEVNSLLQEQMVLQLSDNCSSASSAESSQAPSPATTEVFTEIADNETTYSAYSEDNGDAESVQSFSSTASTVKRKVKEEEVEDDDEEYFPPSKKANKGGNQAPKRTTRKAPARRNRRVQDERVKNQNKVAAMKYRAKKRDEKSTMDVLYEAEEEKNKKLKSQLEELQVNIDVLKELLGKYLKK